ncbi:hypothetical protein MMPV_001870 [Pyropia vietnamensis]
MVTPRSGGRRGSTARLHPPTAAASVLFLTIALWLLFGRHGPPPAPATPASRFFPSPAAEAAYRATRRLALANAAAAAGGTPSSLSSAPGGPTPVPAGDITRRPWASRILVSERRKVLFCPIPKAANSNWKYLLRRLEGYGDYANLSKLHNPALSGLRYLSDYSAGEAATLLADPTYTKFVFVRDPYTRLLSAYMDKIASTQPAFVHAELRTFLAHLMDWRWVKARVASVSGGSASPPKAAAGGAGVAGGAGMAGSGGGGGGGGGVTGVVGGVGHGGSGGIEAVPRPSFRAFVDELLKAPPAAMNAHWAPQTLLCGFGEMPYDFVGRFERLTDDAAALLARIGAPPGVTFPTQAEIGFPPSGAAAVAGDYWSLDLMLKARLLYDVDFHTLGYDAV